LGEKFADLFALTQRTYIAQHSTRASNGAHPTHHGDTPATASPYVPLRALIAHSHDGLDEISAAAPSDMWVVEDGAITVHKRTVQPEEDFGLAAHPIEDFCGGSVEDRVAVFRAVLRGERADVRYGGLEVGAVRDFILLNAAAALFVVGRCADFREGVAIARKAIEEGAVGVVVDKYCTLTNQAK
jgi:anthranilate phosphoribosyltransferase